MSIKLFKVNNAKDRVHIRKSIELIVGGENSKYSYLHVPHLESR